MWGHTDKSGAARPCGSRSRRKRDKAANKAPVGALSRDRVRRKEPAFDEQFLSLAESFGLTPAEFMAKLTMERKLQKLTRG